MPNLESVDVSYNKLQIPLTEEWASHPSLTEVILSGNTGISNLGTLPSKLRILSMAGCAIKTQLKTFPDNLTHFDLSYNKLTAWPTEFPTGIERVLLQGNPISEPLPKWTPSKSLKYIDVTPELMSNETLNVSVIQTNGARLRGRFLAQIPSYLFKDDREDKFDAIACFTYYPRLSFQPILNNAGFYPRLALRFDVDRNLVTSFFNCTRKESFMWRDTNTSKQYTIRVTPDPLRAENWNHVTFQYSALPTQFLHLPDMSGGFLHGISYTLTIELEDYDYPHKLKTRRIVIKDLLRPRCASNQAAVSGTERCVECPKYGKCDGSTTVIADGNSWRPSDKHFRFYPCDDSTQSCLIPGKKRIGNECAEGYKGPLCSMCVTGYGKQGNACAPCPSMGETYFICAMIFIGSAVSQLVMVFLSCPDASQDTNAQDEEVPVESNESKKSFGQKAKKLLQHVADPLKKISKILLTWLFCLGLLARTEAAQQLTAFGKTLLGVMESAATASPMGTGAATCLTEHFIYAHFLYSIIAYVPSCFVIAAIIYLVDHYSDGIEKQWPISLGVTFVAVACLNYPEIMVTAINLLACETLEFPFLANDAWEKNQTTFHHLEYDRRISCSTDAQYERYRSGAWAVLWIIGFGAPVAAILYGSYYSTKAFEYLTAGLRPKAWFWELVTMLRKALLLAIVTIVKKQSLLLMSYTVANYFYLLLTLLVQPYEGSRFYNVLEVFGSATMVVVALHLSALTEFPDDARNVMIGIVVLIFITFVVVVYITGRVLLKAIRPSSAQPLQTPSIPFGNPFDDEDGKRAGGEQKTDQDEINRLTAELAAKERERQELQLQINRLTKEMTEQISNEPHGEAKAERAEQDPSTNVTTASHAQHKPP